MAEIALRSYLQQVDHHIEQKQFDEAIAHCKNILNYHPKSIDAYRLLGKALLEKGRHGDAADIFQRVLSAVPDDFVSHVGMAIVREDEANLEAALWHMERAFESNPANPAVQEELRRLYGRRDGVVPGRARLTRGALARMYLKGELFWKAEHELRSAIAEDSDRLDLWSMLARVLAETGHRAEAADLCGTVLHKLPYNQEANRVLVQVLQDQRRDDEAKPYLQRLEALDPYERYADGHTAAVRDDAVRITFLDYDPDRAGTARPDWAESLGADLREPAGASALGLADDPDWLRMGTGLLATESNAITSALSGPLTADADDPFAAELPEPGELPDWMKDVEPVAAASTPAELPDWMKATTGVLATSTSPSEEKPKKKTGTLTGWLSPEPPVSAIGATAFPVSSELPDWMKDIAPPARPVPDETPTDVLPDAGRTMPIGSEAATLPLGGDEMPDWLKGGQLEEADTRRLAGDFSDDPTRWLGGAPAAPEELPDWMKSIAPAQGQAAVAIPSAAESDELPAWMKDIAPPDSLEADTAAAGDIPDWLKGSAPAAPVDDLPEWLKGGATGAIIGAVSGAVAQPPPPAEPPVAAAQPAVDLGLPDFLQPASVDAIARANEVVDWEEDEPVSAASTPLAAESHEAEVPEWIKSMAPPEPANDLSEIATEELPDWLKPTAEGAPAAADVPAWAQPTEPGASDTIMTWLKDKDQPAPETPDAAPAIPSWLAAADTLPEALATEEMPDWMKAIPPLASEPAAAAPDLSTMSDDEAMAWLEGLALRQGADPAELGAAVAAAGPAEAEPPAWLREMPAPAAEPVAAESAASELPDWMREMAAPAAEAQPPANEPAAAELAATELPDWMGEMPAPAAEAQPSASEPAAAPAAALPDLSTMSDDEAMAWLEGLALRQGADPAELGSAGAAAEPPAAELAATELPDWMREMPAPAAEAQPPANEPPAAELAATELPDWMREMPTPAAEAQPSASEPAAAPAAALPDLSTMSDDEAMAWLEGLALRQGADPAELGAAGAAAEPAAAELAATELPDWMREMPAPAVEAQPPANEPAAAELAPTELPDWMAEMAAPAAEAQPPAAAPAAALPDLSTMSDDEAMAWLEGLALRQGADPAELGAAGAAAEPAELEETPAWLRDLRSADAPAAEVEVEPEWVIPSEPAPTLSPHSGPLMPSTGILPELSDDDAADGPLMPPTGVLPDIFGINDPAAATFVPPPPSEGPPPNLRLSEMSDDEAMAWLEGLALRQGANPAELSAPATGAEPAEAELPEWIKAMQTGAPVVAEPPAAPVAEAPAALSDDEAMAWLEGLAARQGADPASLTTTPEARSETPPAWVSAAGPEPAAPPEPPAPPPLEPLAPEARITAVPQWLSGFEAPTPPPPAAPPATDKVDEEEAMRWLENLAARQGTEFEELVAAADDNPPVDEPAPTPASGLPDWVKAPPPPPTTPAPAPQPPAEAPASAASGSDDRLSRLAEKLSTSRRSKDQDIAERFERERSRREAAHEEIERKMEQRRTQQSKVETGALKRGTGTLRRAEPPPAEAVVPEAAAPEAPAPKPAPAAAKAKTRTPASVPAGTRLTRSRKVRGKKMAFAGQSHAEVLVAAREQLKGGDQAGAAERLEFLIGSGHLLNEVVLELEQATSRGATAPMFYRLLGDAYMRAGQLQNALDAYRLALTQL